MKDPIRRGSTMWVLDDRIQMPPTSNRKPHPRRPVLILSADGTNSDATFGVVMVAPITSTDYSTEFDVKVSAGAGGLEKKGWIRIPLIQPIAKVDVQDRIGQFDAAVVNEVIARWLKYTGSI